MNADDIIGWVGGLAGGGFLGGLGVLYRGRIRARQIRAEAEAASAKLPGEVDNIIVLGAEKTLLMMQGANQTLQAEVARKDAEIQRKDEQIQRLEAGIEALRVTYNQVREQVIELNHALADAARRYDELQADFFAARSEDPPPA